MITFIMPNASAASVPGRMRTCQSAFLAVRVETGSTTTTLAPRALHLSDERPVVQVVADGVDRPQDDVVRVDKAFRIDRGGRAAGHKKGANRRRIAECPFRHNGAEFVEECVAGV